jgi:pyruvate dehydrogenase E1 component
MISRWLPGRLFPLGTDGFGRSDTREALRRFFEIDAECVVIAVLWQLALRGAVDRSVPARAVQELGVDPEKVSPVLA